MKLDFDEIRKELFGYQVTLDKDPSSKSLVILYEKLAQAKSYLERVAHILMTIMKFKDIWERKYRTQEDKYESLFSQLLVNNEEVQAKSSRELREAAAKNKLLAMREEVLKARGKYMALKSFYDEISIKYSDLKLAYEGISRQITLIEDMTYLGEIRRTGDMLKDKSEERMRVKFDV